MLRRMTADEHRRLGIELYNGTWELLEAGADPDLPGAYEALARAHAAAGDRFEAARYVELARAAIATIDDAEDREHLESQLASIPVG
jgi:hypothetical protein